MYEFEDENKKIKTELTINEFKSFKGCEYLSDEEAKNTIHFLKQFSLITYELFKKQEK